jgi:hypothetical protein
MPMLFHKGLLQGLCPGYLRYQTGVGLGLGRIWERSDHMKQRDFAQELRDIDEKVTQLFGLVSENMAAATDALPATG